MKQICYLSSPAKKERWDPLFLSLDIVSNWYGTDEIRSLTAFVAREQLLYMQDYILIDLEDASWSNEHMLSALQMLRRIFSGPVIFLSPENSRTTQLYSLLAQPPFLIRALFWDSEGIEARLANYLEDPYRAGHMNDLAAARLAGVAAQAEDRVSPLTIPPGLTVTLAVTGATHRCGTTTQTFALYHYLKSLGFRPAVMDDTGTGDRLLDYADKREAEDGIMYLNGIPFCTQRRDEFNAYLVDTGVYRSDCAALQESQLAVLVGCAKLWELPPLFDIWSRLRNGRRDEPPPVLISFATPEELTLLRKQLGDRTTAVAYHPDLLAPPAPAPYHEVILPCLKDICGGVP